MESSKTLIEAVARAKKEVEGLLAEANAAKPDKTKLKAGLEAVQGNLKVLDIHVHKRDGQ